MLGHRNEVSVSLWNGGLCLEGLDYLEYNGILGNGFEKS